MSKIYTTPFDWGYVDDNTLIYNDTSEEAIKEMINEALDEAMEDVKEEVVDEALSSMDIKLEGGDLLYKLIVNGNENGEINIPKDQFLKTASYDKDAKKLVFVMETTDGETTTEVNISDLVSAIEEKNVEQDTELDAKADKSELEQLATKEEVAAVDAKVDAIEIPSVEGLATKEEVAAVDAKVDAIEIPSIEGLATKEEIENKVDWVESTPGRKHIVLSNHDSVLGTATDGQTYNVAMVSKWDVADFGSSQLHLNLNSKDGIATINDDKAIATEDFVSNSIASAVETLATKEELNTATASAVAQVVANAPEDFDTLKEVADYIASDKTKASEIETKLGQHDTALETKADKSELEPLATKEEVTAVDAKVDAIEIPSIEGLAKSADVTAEIATAIAPLATKEEVAAVDAKVDAIEIPSIEGLAKSADVTAEIATAIAPLAVKSEMTEEVNAVSAALADFEADTNVALNAKANAADVYTKTESEEKFQASGDYVPVEQYNDLKARLDNLEIMLSVYNAEREAQMDEIISNMSSDNKEVVIDTLMESIVVPETTVAYTITAPLTDNSTVELTSPKYMTLINTSKEPVSTTISHTYEEGETTSATTVYLVGDFDTLTVENISPSVKSGYDAASVKNVVIPETNVKNLSLSLDFQDGATITNNSDKDITIYDKSNSEIALSIVAPNSTVTLNNGQFTTLNAEVSDNTLIIKKNVHIGNLNLEKGNAIVEVARAEEVAGIVENYTVADGYTLSHRIYHITNENSSKLGGVGEMILDEDITRTSSIVAPLAPAYDAVWNLNGHNITVEGTPKSGVYLNRYTSNLEVKGEGVIRAEGAYGLWNAATSGKIIINDGVTIEAQTHAVYAEKGIIEINGGTFKLTNWAEADKDENGNLRFLINCLDANYKNGSANIIVKGGKFYDFDPSNCAAEGVGTSFVAEGYGSIMTTETIDGVEHRVYEVKPING